MRCRILLSLYLCLPASLYAQLTSATISGKVADSAGASIPGASVTATDSKTGAVSHAEADGQGSYAITWLAPDPYVVVISRDGFRSYEQRNLVLTVEQTVTINASLQPGAVSQRVVVEAAGSEVDTRSPSVTTAINSEMIRELPLNGRNVLQLMQLAPDTGPTGSSGYQQSAWRYSGPSGLERKLGLFDRVARRRAEESRERIGYLRDARFERAHARQDCGRRRFAVHTDAFLQTRVSR